MGYKTDRSETVGYRWLRYGSGTATVASKNRKNYCMYWKNVNHQFFKPTKSVNMRYGKYFLFFPFFVSLSNFNIISGDSRGKICVWNADQANLIKVICFRKI